MTTTSPECLFCRIVAGEVPATVVHETESTLAFRDISPIAPTHVLVVPRNHHADAAALAAAEPAVAAELLTSAAAIAEAEGLSGYRLVLNTGEDGGQTVFHAHLHVIGGTRLTWPS